jgi:DNA-binding transcriptional regulator YiaG
MIRNTRPARQPAPDDTPPDNRPTDADAGRDERVTDEEWAQPTTASDLLAQIEETDDSHHAFHDAASYIARRQHNLAQLRQARQLTQIEMSRALGVHQAQLSRLEHRENWLLTTLANYIAATGGKLHLIVTYPDDPEPIELVPDELLDQASADSAS